MNESELEKTLGERNVYATLNEMNSYLRLNKPGALVHKWGNVGSNLAINQMLLNEEQKEYSFSELKQKFNSKYESILTSIKEGLDNKFIKI